MVSRRAQLLLDSISDLPEVGIVDIREDETNGLGVSQTQSLSAGIWLIVKLLDGLLDSLASFFGDGYPAIGKTINYIRNSCR